MQFLQLFLVFAAIFLRSTSAEDSKHDIQKVIINSVNQDQDPCGYFSHYACKLWYELDQDSPYRSVMGMMTYETNMEFIEYMANVNVVDQPKFVKKAKDFYESCKSTKEINIMQYEHWLRDNENIKWALSSKPEDEEAEFDWPQTMAVARKYGFNGIFIKENLVPSKTDTSKMIADLSVYQNVMNLPSTDDYELQELKNTLNLPSLKEIRKFELRLRKVIETKDEEGPKSTTVKDLSQTWLRKYLSLISLDEDTEVHINSMARLETLDFILREYGNKFLCSYLEIRFLIYLSENYKMSTDLECMSNTRDFLPLAMHWIYEQLHPEVKSATPEISQIFDKIVKNINETLRADKSGIISDKALAKLETIQLKVGNLPRVNTIQTLESFYDDVTISSTDLCGNRMQLLKFHVTNNQKLGSTDFEFHHNEFFDKKDKGYGEDIIIPRYIPSANMVIVPSYILRAPIYDLSYDNFWKYSSLGYMMSQLAYTALDLDGWSEKDIIKIANVGSLHNIYEIIFSQSTPEELNTYQSEIADSMKLPLKKIFFLSVGKNFCGTRILNRNINDMMMIELPAFVETFDCKFNKFLRIFKK